MSQAPVLRTVGAVAVAAIGFVTAIGIGAPPPAALLAMLGGGLAFAFLPSLRSEPPGRVDAAYEGVEDGLPHISELLRAVDEPMLIVRDRRVLTANAPARGLLEDHVEGADVRLAIRHPAAAESLTRSVGESDTTPMRTELVGLGEPDRQWVMTVTSLSDESQIVRLTDQSGARALEQMRADFVANASHELRTPLATILGFLETLQDEGSGADAES